MTIYYDGDQHLSQAQQEQIERILETVLTVENLLQAGEVSISLVSDDEIRQLNRDYRNKDQVTDVLSFPQVESLDEARQANYLFLGDIVINLDQVIRQAKEFQHSEARELSYLTVHSLYHLLGFDHETDDEKLAMRKKEKYIMQILEGK
ncbi:MAG: rRNA maturation RNase YbeY [Tissierellia bacterium]|nr:rRNA maturation RNase YbeY [Tissierellia bacterium]